jgi:hypothetical protein
MNKNVNYLFDGKLMRFFFSDVLLDQHSGDVVSITTVLKVHCCGFIKMSCHLCDLCLLSTESFQSDEYKDIYRSFEL